MQAPSYSILAGTALLAALPLLGYGQLTNTESSAQVGITAALASQPGARQKYPTTRLLTVQYDALTPRKVDLTNQNVPFLRSRGQDMQQMRVFGALPLLLSKPLILMTNFVYLREWSAYEQVEPASGGASLGDRRLVRNDLNLSLTAFHNNKLLQRPITYLASVTANSRDVEGIEKVTGYVAAIYTLKSTPTTKMTVGALVLLNPAVNVPGVPLFTYWHRFAKSPWELDVLLPSRIHLRRPLPLAPKGWLSVGSQLATTHFFGSTTYQPLARTYEWATNSLQTGALVEYPLHKMVLLGVRGGLNSQLSSRISRRNTTEYLIDADARQSLYLGASLSFVPGSQSK